MRRGTRVGQAYVAITADGSGIGDDIADAFDDVDYNKITKDFGAEWGDSMRARLTSLEKEMDKKIDSLGKHIEADETIRNAVAKMTAEYFDLGALDPLIKRVSKRVSQEFGDGFEKESTVAVQNAIESMFLRIAQDPNNKMDLSELFTVVKGDGDDEFGIIGPLLERAEAEARASAQRITKAERAELEKRHAQTLKEVEEFSKALKKKDRERLAALVKETEAAVKEAQRREAEAAKETARLNEKFAKDHQRSLEESANAAIKSASRRQTMTRRQIKELMRLENQYTAKILTDLRKRDDAWSRSLYGRIDLERKARAEAEKLAAKAVSRNRPGDQGVDISGTIGRMFGGGSRNNFLNLIGRSIGGVISLGQKFIGVFTGIGSLASKFAQGFSSAADSASQWQKVMAGLGQQGVNVSGMMSRVVAAAPGMVAALAAAAIGAVIATVALSALVSAAWALVGVLTALVGVVVSALAGALLVAGAGIAALTATVGLAVIAFTTLTDAQKKMFSEAFTPLKQELAGLGALMSEQFTKKLYDGQSAVQLWAANLRTALQGLAPLAQAMGQAFAQVGINLTAALSGPGVQQFIQALAVYLPSVVTNLSLAFGQFMNGLPSMFAALMPHVAQFSQYLADVTLRFQNWAASAEGQNSITKFADEAVRSLKSLWGAVREVFGFLGDVLTDPATQKLGREMFDSIADSFKRFRKLIQDGRLEKWFKDAKKFGTQLWRVMLALKDVFVALYSSGVLDKLGAGLEFLAGWIETCTSVGEGLANVFSKVWPAAIGATFGPIGTLIGLLKTAYEAMASLIGQASKLPGGGVGGSWGDGLVVQGYKMANNAYQQGSTTTQNPKSPLYEERVSEANQVKLPNTNLSGVGSDALAGGALSGGGDTGDAGGAGGAVEKAAKAWKNPYVAWANSLIKEGPTFAQQIGDAMKAMNKEIAKAIREAGKSIDAASVRDSLRTQVESMRETAKSQVDTARDSLNSAAQSLASATSAADAARALAEVRRAQKDLKAAQKAQEGINKAAKLLNAQKIVSDSRVKDLVAGLNVENATLADFAKARGKLAEMIEEANSKLADAIQIRDSYKDQVADSIKSFGALTTAQAQVIDGVEQALTANDIISNMQTKLEQIRVFQDNLRILLARGLSQDAYKQLVDAGVDVGGEYAAALIEGGQGAVSQVNNLVAAIGAKADELGLETSKRLYQAGVDAAQGIVDGLKAKDEELKAAATRLGEMISKAVKKALGIKSPSTVMIDNMGYVGSGLVLGLDAQQREVSNAAGRLASMIAVSPEVALANYRASQTAPVSGNGSAFRDLIVQTPTENPTAVAREVLNEVVGVI